MHPTTTAPVSGLAAWLEQRASSSHTFELMPHSLPSRLKAGRSAVGCAQLQLDVHVRAPAELEAVVSTGPQHLVCGVDDARLPSPRRAECPGQQTSRARSEIDVLGGEAPGSVLPSLGEQAAQRPAGRRRQKVQELDNCNLVGRQQRAAYMYPRRRWLCARRLGRHFWHDGVARAAALQCPLRPSCVGGVLCRDTGTREWVAGGP